MSERVEFAERQWSAPGSDRMVIARSAASRSVLAMAQNTTTTSPRFMAAATNWKIAGFCVGLVIASKLAHIIVQRCPKAATNSQRWRASR